MSDVAISIENLGKAYHIGLKEEIPDSLVGAAIGWVKAPLHNLRRLRRLNTFNVTNQTSGNGGADEDDILWALKDVSFEIKRGEVVGIIGRNGAGKSTLLKVLSRITEPTTGRVVISGRVSSLLEVGTGFHPELTGRENIYMNGTILGMAKREIDRKFDEIVDFSGVERFLDTPVKRYSSGMQVRLAFAVAAHLEPEILIIDEVLAVGDAEFQKKCMGKMQDVSQGGRTVLFVSHNLAAIESLCSHGILLADGALVTRGLTSDVVTEYSSSLRPHGSMDSNISLVKHPNRRNGCEEILTRLAIRDATGNLRNEVSCSEPLSFDIEFCSAHPRQGLCFAVFLCSRGSRLIMLHTETHSRLTIPKLSRGCVRCEIESLPLVPGVYDIDVAVGDVSGLPDYIECAGSLTVIPGNALGSGLLPTTGQSMFLLPAQWEIV